MTRRDLSGGVVPALVLLGLGGAVLGFVAVERWSPDWSLKPTPQERLLEQAALDAADLGYRPESAGTVQVSAGPRFFASLNGLAPLVEAHPDPELRRQLIDRAPPLRLGVRFWRAVAPNGATGTMLLEYDCDARLVAASFGIAGLDQRGLPPPSREYFADRLAGMLLGDPLPMREETGLGGPVEFLYRRADDMPNAYVYLGSEGGWMAELQPVPVLVVTHSASALWDRLPLVQALVWTTGGLAVLALVVLLWRLGRRRAGFGQAPYVAALLAVGLLPMIGQWQGSTSLVALIWAYYVLTQVAVVLGWTVGEAELRDAQPAALEHWDRSVGRRPVAETGRQLMIGVAVGCLLGGALAASGEMVAQWGGGYRSVLVLLPDYWTLSSPLNVGLALAATVAFLVGLGGRLGRVLGHLGGRRGGSWEETGVRVGVLAGAVLSGLAWALVTPVAPLRWSLVVGLCLGLASGWIVWYCGLLTVTVACVTALSLPTAVLAWSVPQHLGIVAAIASLPVPLFVLGWLVWRRAPTTGDIRAVMPSYVSDREHEARLEGEVELLRNLQLALLPPRRKSAVGDVEVAWRMIPADLVGGDFLDVIEDDEGRLWLAVADVAGHGISCSVLTAFTKAAVAEHAVAGTGPAEALSRIRRLFGRLHPSRRTLVTLQLALFTPGSRELRVASAGHPPLLVRDPGGVREVGLGGSPLGVDLGDDAAEEVVHCPDETLVVAFTDGVGEAVSPDDEAFGYERWQTLLARMDGTSAQQVLERLLAAVEEHRRGRPADDDVTAAVLRIAPPGGYMSTPRLGGR